MIRLGVLFFAYSLASASALADGIAFSTDGHAWTTGAGSYGKGWGDVGQGISVRAGSTIYIKYYSISRDGNALSYATHGAKWGNWLKVGPALTGSVGNDPANSIILRVDNIGTPQSSARWMNGTGTWGGILFPGAYDFGFDRNALWTRPPLVVQPAERPSWWAALWRPSSLAQTEPESTTGVTVSDSGGTAVLLGCALLSAALLWRGLRRRAAKKQDSTADSR